MSLPSYQQYKQKCLRREIGVVKSDVNTVPANVKAIGGPPYFQLQHYDNPKSPHPTPLEKIGPITLDELEDLLVALQAAFTAAKAGSAGAVATAGGAEQNPYAAP